jgi:hypothetical protein
MRVRSSSLSVVLTIVLLASVALVGCTAPAETPAPTATADATPAAEKGGQDEFGPYDVVANWPQPLPDGPDGVKHDGWTWGSTGAVYAETPNRIWIAMRGELPLPAGAKPWTPYGMLNPTRGNATGNDDGLSATCEPTTEKRGWERRYHHVLFVVDGEGKQVDYWPQHDKLFQERCGRGPHKIKMNPYDPDKHVWVIDDQLHTIYKFTYDGNLVMTLGTKGQRGRDAGKLFDRPTDIDWLPDGTFFISDGYGGTRVAKFDKDGKFLMAWGEKGSNQNDTRPGYFNNVHGIAVDPKTRRIFVNDRGNHRAQVFDENGKFLDSWRFGDPPSDVHMFNITSDGFLWAADRGTNRILKYDLNGNFMYSWGTWGDFPGGMWGVHGMSVDQEGNFYVAEVDNGGAQKFTPRAGANPAFLMTKPAAPTTGTR